MIVEVLDRDLIGLCGTLAKSLCAHRARMCFQFHLIDRFGKTAVITAVVGMDRLE